MKIAVIGTSNGVLGNKGFVKALRLRHEVVNLSAGRNPLFYHIKTILNNRDLIEDQDLLIVDHYINTQYFVRMNEYYLDKCREFYDILSSLNVPILNVFFPIKNIGKNPRKLEYRDFVRQVSDRHRISSLDLNTLPFQLHHFRNALHLTVEASYLLGLFLSGEVSRDKLGDRPTGGRLVRTPFTTMGAGELAHGNAVGIFENSLMSVRYVDLRDEVRIVVSDTAKLVSLGYLRPKELSGCSGIDINGRAVGLGDTGYFHEALDFEVTGDIHLKPVFDDDQKLRNLMGRGKSRGRFAYCYLCDLLLHDARIAPDLVPADRQLFEIRVDGLPDALDSVCPPAEPTRLSGKAVNMIRDMAIGIGDDDPAGACELLRLAARSRPGGSGIQKKLAEYQDRLDGTDPER